MRPAPLVTVSCVRQRSATASPRAALLPPRTARLTFGYLETERDKYRYQSSEVQYVGLDELIQFAESQYLYLFSRLRRHATSEVPLRMRSVKGSQIAIPVLNSGIA